MSVLRHAVPIAALVLVVGACQSTPAASPSVAPPASSAPASAAAPGTGAAPTAAAPTTTTASPVALGGTWNLVVTNAHVISATGDHVGGTVAIDGGNRSIFTAGEYRSSDPIEISGTRSLDCNAKRCRIEGVALWEIHVVDGDLAIVNAGMLTPLGSFGDSCAWEDVPEGGIITVVSTGMVSGQEVPTVVTFSDGTASGVGTACDMGSYSVAWDVTATRQQ